MTSTSTATSPIPPAPGRRRLDGWPTHRGKALNPSARRRRAAIAAALAERAEREPRRRTPTPPPLAPDRVAALARSPWRCPEHGRGVTASGRGCPGCAALLALTKDERRRLRLWGVS